MILPCLVHFVIKNEIGYYLPNEVLAVATKGGMLEESWNKLVIFNLANVLFLECTLSLASCTPSTKTLFVIIAVGLLLVGPAVILAGGTSLVLVVDSHVLELINYLFF